MKDVPERKRGGLGAKMALSTAGLLLAAVLAASGQGKDFSAETLQSERSRSYDMLHYRIAIRLDLDEKSFEGDATISLAGTSTGSSTSGSSSRGIPSSRSGAPGTRGGRS